MGMRMLPFFKSKKGWQFAGGGNIDEYGDLPIATENSPGCVKPDGTTTTVSSAGALSANTATGSAAGIVKPDGSTITIEDGVISAATATGSAAGIVKPDGETIEINDGVISTPALIQKEELPTASEDELGKRYLYTGATGSGLFNGYVYKCVSDGGDPATYSWVAVDVQSRRAVVASVTADGVKTVSQICDELYSLIKDRVVRGGVYVIDYNTYQFYVTVISSGSIRAGLVSGDMASSVDCYYLLLQSTGSIYCKASIGSTVRFDNQSSVVSASGVTITVYSI